jgi:hypothetical protein
MTSDEKCLNNKVVDLIESYNFRIIFILIRVHTKSYDFFKREATPIARGNGDMSHYSTCGGLLYQQPIEMAVGAM